MRSWTKRRTCYLYFPEAAQFLSASSTPIRPTNTSSPHSSTKRANFFFFCNRQRPLQNSIMGQNAQSNWSWGTQLQRINVHLRLSYHRKGEQKTITTRGPGCLLCGSIWQGSYSQEISKLWLPKADQHSGSVECRVGILYFMANIYLSVSTYHVCPFGSVLPPSGWYFQVPSIYLRISWNHCF